MKPRPTVSVVIPTFNRSDLVVHAIDSALNQTYRPHEIIVIDDGSTDDTSAILGPYMGQIRYVRQENRGASAAQNEGVKLATGEWVAILGSDDIWLPRKLELQIRAVALLGSRFGACFTDCHLFEDSIFTGAAFTHKDFEGASEIGPCMNPVGLLLSARAVIYVQSLMFRKDLFEEAGRFDERLFVSEDVDLLFRMAQKTEFCFVNTPLVHIDRTPSRERLTDLFARGEDRMFLSQEIRLKKWQTLPGSGSSEQRRTIDSQLQEIYFAWTISKIYQFQWLQALAIVRRQHGGGLPYRLILNRLGMRACRRLLRTVVRRPIRLTENPSFSSQ